jgi:hypothetical protein
MVWKIAQNQNLVFEQQHYPDALAIIRYWSAKRKITRNVVFFAEQETALNQGFMLFESWSNTAHYNLKNESTSYLGGCWRLWGTARRPPWSLEAQILQINVFQVKSIW